MKGLPLRSLCSRSADLPDQNQLLYPILNIPCVPGEQVRLRAPRKVPFPTCVEGLTKQPWTLRAHDDDHKLIVESYEGLHTYRLPDLDPDTTTVCGCHPLRRAVLDDPPSFLCGTVVALTNGNRWSATPAVDLTSQQFIAH